MNDEISRRDFLKIAGVATSLPLTPGQTQESKERKVAADSIPEWKEITPLTQAGAEFLGVQKEQIGETKINETRAYRLPPNPEFKNSTLVAISSRMYPKDLPDDDAAVNSYGGMRLLVIPNEIQSKSTDTKYDRTLTFGNLTINIIQKEKGRIKLWESEFYVNGNRIIDYDNHSFETHIEHIGYSETYFNKSVYFADEKCHILTPNGVEARDERTLVFETVGGNFGSVVIPKGLPGENLGEITVAHAGKLTLVKGLTENPFSYVSESEIPDGQGWV